MRKRLSAGALAVLVLAAGALLFAQQDGIKRTMMQKIEYPSGHLTLMGTAELPPGGSLPRHTHPGIETGYVLEGECLMSVEGQPDRVVKAGESYLIPAGVPHSLKNSSPNKNLKGLSTWVVEKDKPFSTPVPK
jgi:quercetin dioxygenase-like cupin family protein